MRPRCGGNYASSLLPQQEANEHGCAQVAFLDSSEHRWVEELGGMNLYFVHADGSIVTPSLSGSILPGITRDSILALARDLGPRSGRTAGEHRRVARRLRRRFDHRGVRLWHGRGRHPGRALKWDGGEAVAADGEAGKVTLDIRSALVDIQYGRAEDRHGWMTNVIPA